MFYGYRFDHSGKYDHPDELESVQDVYNYVIGNKSQYARVMVTCRSSDTIQVEAINGQIVFPLQWALLEIKRLYLDSEVFIADRFYESLKRSGFTNISKPNSHDEAEMLLQFLYQNLPDPTV